MERCKLLTSSDSFSKEVALFPPHGGKKRSIMCVILQVYLAIRNYRNHRDRSRFSYKGQKLSSGHWDSICNITSEYFPAFYDFVLSQFQIDSTEYRICLLLRLHFKGGEIAHVYRGRSLLTSLSRYCTKEFLSCSYIYQVQI